jgi:L-lactate dehydrogenase complex protein LldG
MSRIRKAQDRSVNLIQGERAEAERYLASRSRGPIPKNLTSVLDRFTAESHRMSSTIDTVQEVADVPRAIARYLGAQAIPLVAIAWKTMGLLPWASAGLQVEHRPPNNEDLVGITECEVAVAETGTLVMLSGNETFASASLLPETHICVVKVSQIVFSMEDAFDRIRDRIGIFPRAVNFVSGPSRTGDIEQTIVLGAHGPYRVHIVIVQS